MRINLHDFSGHPFQVQLSRELARRGHAVEHTYCSQYTSGHGRLHRGPDDPSTLKLTGLSANTKLDKYNLKQRLRFEASYAHSWKAFLDQREFDLVVSCNVPLVSLAMMQRYFKRRSLPWVFWHQDVYSKAMSDELARRLPIGSGVVSRALARLEAQQVRNASRVVAITPAFIAQYRKWGLRTDHATVIPNWAPLDEIIPEPRDNPWSRAQQLPEDGLRLMYSGTLGRKHNPTLLLQLLDAVQAQGMTATLTVCSEGVGADDLAAEASGRSDVRVLKFQPAEQFSQVLGSADVMVTLLEPSASEFSVPSKVLSYMAAGRPILGLMPADNPAAVYVTEVDGFVVPPDDAGALAGAQWVARVAKSASDLHDRGLEARRLAEARFGIAEIADNFESAFSRVGSVFPSVDVQSAPVCNEAPSSSSGSSRHPG